MKDKQKEQENSTISIDVNMGTAGNNFNIVCTAIDLLDRSPYQRFMYTTTVEQAQIVKEVAKAHEFAESPEYSYIFPVEQGSSGCAKIRDPDHILYSEFPTINKVIDRAKKSMADCLGVPTEYLNEEVRYVRSQLDYDWHTDKTNTVIFVMTFGDEKAFSTPFAKDVTLKRGNLKKELMQEFYDYETTAPGGATVFRGYDALHSRPQHNKENPRLILFLDVPVVHSSQGQAKIKPWPDVEITEAQSKARQISDATFSLIGNQIDLDPLTVHKSAYYNNIDFMTDIRKNINLSPNTTILPYVTEEIRQEVGLNLNITFQEL